MILSPGAGGKRPGGLSRREPGQSKTGTSESGQSKSGHRNPGRRHRWRCPSRHGGSPRQPVAIRRGQDRRQCRKRRRVPGPDAGRSQPTIGAATDDPDSSRQFAGARKHRRGQDRRQSRKRRRLPRPDAGRGQSTTGLATGAPDSPRGYGESCGETPAIRPTGVRIRASAPPGSRDLDRRLGAQWQAS